MIAGAMLLIVGVQAVALGLSPARTASITWASTIRCSSATTRRFTLERGLLARRRR